MDDVVVVVGAGLAGLSAALELAAHDVPVRLLEAGDEVGGRVRTDVVDGFRLDRGFQVLNPAYPAVRALVDLPALRPQRFWRAVRVVDGDHVRLLGHPLDCGTALRGVTSIPPRDLAVLGALALRDVAAPDRLLTGAADQDSRAELARWGLSDATVERVLAPFLAGVFLEPALSTSSRFLHLVLRSFLRAAPVLPADGMAALPRQLAARLPEGTLSLDTDVRAVSPSGVDTESEGRIAARAVIVATDGTSAADLLPGLPTVHWNAVTTHYYRSPRPPLRQPVITVDARQGPVVNSVVLSEVAPGYAPAGVGLVSASVLGTSGADDQQVRQHLAHLYGTDVTDWESLAAYSIPMALPAMPAPHPLRRPVRLSPGLYVCGDHRDTSSIQGALVSGRRAARAVLADLRTRETA